MNISITERKKGDLDLGLIYGAIGVMGFFTVRLFSRLADWIPPCPLHQLTGFPCPTCGSTRSGILLSRFQIVDAFLINPLFVLVCLSVGIWAAAAAVLHLSGKKWRVELTGRAKRAIRIGIVVMILLNWIYLVFVEFH